MPEWTQEQKDVIEAIAGGNGNLVVNSVAGSGKTTTIVAGVMEWAARGRREERTGRALLCAFNKRIAEELGSRIQSEAVLCATMNSLGHRAWMRVVRGVKLDPRKTYSLLKPHFDFGKSGDTPRLISLCKSAGFVPTAEAPKWGLTPGFVPDTDEWLEETIDAFGLDCPLGEPTRSGLNYFDAIRAIMGASISEAFSGFIDYDDQLYMSCMARAPFERFNLVMVDEAQDINAIQQRIISLSLTPRGRLIAVGDRNQAIYGFRGAGHNAIDQIKEAFSAEEKQLTYSFRCPTSVIREAQEYVPHIKAAPGAEEGEVSTLSGTVSTSIFTQSDVILCRNVRPLVELCHTLIRAKIPCAVLGRDIGTGLIALVKKATGKKTVPLKELYNDLTTWSNLQQSSLMSKGKEDQAASLQDRVDSICSIISSFEEEDPQRTWTTDDLFLRIETMFSNDTARLTLSTVHKAKGLEWDRVFILDRWRMPSKWARTPEAKQQELNCLYVAITRARRSLIYIDARDIKP